MPYFLIDFSHSFDPITLSAYKYWACKHIDINRFCVFFVSTLVLSVFHNSSEVTGFLFNSWISPNILVRPSVLLRIIVLTNLSSI